MADDSPRSLRRFSTRYVESEDRVRLTGKVGEGAPEVVWLTQRLCQRLIPALAKWLEEQGAGGAHGELLQVFAQQSARADIIPGPPIRPGGDSRHWVARSVHLAKRGRGIGLTFAGAGDDSVFVAFTVKGLRQWLSIVYAAYTSGGWPLDAWPQWIKDAAAASGKRGSTLH
jgi:hypothetical protein